MRRASSFSSPALRWCASSLVKTSSMLPRLERNFSLSFARAERFLLPMIPPIFSEGLVAEGGHSMHETGLIPPSAHKKRSACLICRVPIVRKHCGALILQGCIGWIEGNRKPGSVLGHEGNRRTPWHRRPTAWCIRNGCAGTTSCFVQSIEERPSTTNTARTRSSGTSTSRRRRR